MVTYDLPSHLVDLDRFGDVKPSATQIPWWNGGFSGRAGSEDQPISHGFSLFVFFTAFENTQLCRDSINIYKPYKDSYQLILNTVQVDPSWVFRLCCFAPTLMETLRSFGLKRHREMKPVDVKLYSSRGIQETDIQRTKVTSSWMFFVPPWNDISGNFS